LLWLSERDDMSAIFEFPIDDEILSGEELVQITGSARKKDQVDWLTNNSWSFHKNRAGDPIVGRLYARLKLAGINPPTLAAGGWIPDFTGIR